MDICDAAALYDTDNQCGGVKESEFEMAAVEVVFVAEHV